TRVALLARADVGAVLDPRDVDRVGRGVEGVRILRLIEPDEGARADEEVGQLHPLLVTAGAPVDVVGLGQLCDLGDPVEDPLVGRGLLGGCGSHAWLGPSRASRTPHAGGDRPPSVSAEWSLGATSPTPWMSGIGQYPHGFSGRAIGSIHAIHPRRPSTPSITQECPPVTRVSARSSGCWISRRRARR